MGLYLNIAPPPRCPSVIAILSPDCSSQSGAGSQQTLLQNKIPMNTTIHVILCYQKEREYNSLKGFKKENLQKLHQLKFFKNRTKKIPVIDQQKKGY